MQTGEKTRGEFKVRSKAREAKGSAGRYQGVMRDILGGKVTPKNKGEGRNVYYQRERNEPWMFSRKRDGEGYSCPNAF